MSTTIYYFTGTGNSLWTARKIAERQDDAELIPMARAWQAETVEPESNTVGLVFPLYFQGSPDIVLRFSQKLVLDKVDYLFAVCTRGVTGGIVFKQLNEILEKKARRLNYASYLSMPDNYIINFNAPKKTKSMKMYARAEAKIAKMTEIINRKTDTNPHDPLCGSIMGNISYPGWIAGIHTKDNQFWTDERCNSCGTCVKVCPVNNIELVDGKPSWLHRCQQCYACIHLCPKDSIQIGKKTLKRIRYRHPEIKVKDIIRQKG